MLLADPDLHDRSVARTLSLLEAGHPTPPPAPPRCASPQHTRREVRPAERLRRLPDRQKRFAACSLRASSYPPAPPPPFPPRAPPPRRQECSHQNARCSPS